MSSSSSSVLLKIRLGKLFDHLVVDQAVAKKILKHQEEHPKTTIKVSDDFFVDLGIVLIETINQSEKVSEFNLLNPAGFRNSNLFYDVLMGCMYLKFSARDRFELITAFLRPDEAWKTMSANEKQVWRNKHPMPSVYQSLVSLYHRLI